MLAVDPAAVIAFGLVADTTTSEPAAAPLTRVQRFTLVATSLGLFMMFLDVLIVNVALPAIQRDYAVGEAGLQWIVTAYSLGMAVAIMSAATLADLHGRKKLYLLGITLFTASSVACGFAPSLLALNLARGVQGIAAATVNVASLALLSAAFPEPKQKALAIGIWTAIANVATAVGPTLGGVLVQTVGWRSIFLVNLPVGLVVLYLTSRHVVESRDQRPRQFDWWGQILFVIAIGAFAFAMIQAPRAGWFSPGMLALWLVAAAGLAAFIFVERRSADPMMDLSLFGDRTYRLAIATIFSVLFAVYGTLLVTTQYLQNVRGLSPIEAGLLLLPYSITATIVSFKVGGLVGRVGARPPILVGLLVTIAGLAVMAIGLQVSIVVVTLGLVLTAFGDSLCLPPTTSVAMTSVPPERAGMASGIMSAQRAIGSTVGLAVIGSILAAWLGATLNRDLAVVLPDPVVRREVAARIVQDANPRAFAAEVGPGRPVPEVSGAVREEILAAADADFIRGIQAGLAAGILVLAMIFLAGYAGFPRGAAALAGAQREAARIEAREAGLESAAGPDP